jgi:hypothetical protein
MCINKKTILITVNLQNYILIVGGGLALFIFAFLATETGQYFDLHII